MIISQLKVLAAGSEVGSRIGEPVHLSESGKVKVTDETVEPQRNVLGSNLKVSPSQKSSSAIAMRTETASPKRESSIPNSTQPSTSRALCTLGGNPMVPIAPPKRFKENHLISELNLKSVVFKIRARVIAKSDIRQWSNAKGEGKFFHMDIIDESGQMRVTAFRDHVDKYYDMIEVRIYLKTNEGGWKREERHQQFVLFQLDKVYYILNGQVELSNKKYSDISNDYEMVLNIYSDIWECRDDAHSVPTMKYEFIPIAQIAEKPLNTIVGKD